MISKGLSDLRVVIGSDRVDSMRCILMNGNETFRKLLEDVEIGEELVLCEGSSVDGFIEMEKYYSGGSMELNDENVLKVFLMSIYYNDKEILEVCIKYIKNHLNDEMILRILELSDLLKKEEIFELIRMSEEYLRENGYKYLNNGISIYIYIQIEILLFKLRIENLRIILENESLIIKDENWLLKVLMKWNKNEMKKIENEEEKKELKEEFKRMLSKSIHIDKLRINEIEIEILDELKKIDMSEYFEEMKDKMRYKEMKIEEVEDERILELILKYYKNEEEELIKEEDLRELKNENIIWMLLESEDIKMKEIGLLIMIESRMKYKNINQILNKKKRREILIELIGEYRKECSNNRVIKCLCLFIEKEEYLNTIKCLCGNRILCELLNYDNYYSKESKELMMEYIKESRLSLEEEEEMERIIENEEIIEELKTKEISSFSFPKSECSFGINEEISIIPSYDGNRCEFSISPPLPLGVRMNKENGIINGKIDSELECKEYEICCKNVKNEKKFKISLGFVDIKFTKLNKSNGISISNNGKIIACETDNNYSHCYLNLKMENGIYHIKYKFHQNRSFHNCILLGLSTDNTYSGDNIDNQSTSFAFAIWNYLSYIHCHIGTIVNSNPNFKNHGDDSIYEVIVDMNKREFWISHNNSDPVLLVKDLPSPLYPYAELYYSTTSVELLSVSHHN